MLIGQGKENGGEVVTHWESCLEELLWRERDDKRSDNSNQRQFGDTLEVFNHPVWLSSPYISSFFRKILCIDFLASKFLLSSVPIYTDVSIFKGHRNIIGHPFLHLFGTRELLGVIHKLYQ